MSNLSHIKDNKDILLLILMSKHSFKDEKNTIVINAVFQSGMSMFLYAIKDHFEHIVIVGHPTTLRYCYKVLGEKEYIKKIVWVSNIIYKNIKNAVIIADSPNKSCDWYVDFDYYNIEKRNVASYILPYYRSPARFYHGRTKSLNFQKIQSCVFLEE